MAKTAEKAYRVGPPPKVNAVDVAFGGAGGATRDLLPPWSAIPDDFKRRGNPWAEQVSMWFFKGPDKAWLERITPKPGIDKNAALTAARMVLGSFEPKHEHKEAGVAFLLASWFEDPSLAAVQP